MLPSIWTKWMEIILPLDEKSNKEEKKRKKKKNMFKVLNLNNIYNNFNTERNYNRRQNCWHIVLKQGNFREQKNLHPSPPLPSIQSWSVCCFLQVAWTAAQHWMGGGGMGEEKLFIPL